MEFLKPTLHIVVDIKVEKEKLVQTNIPRDYSACYYVSSRKKYLPPQTTKVEKAMYGLECSYVMSSKRLKILYTAMPSMEWVSEYGVLNNKV